MKKLFGVQAEFNITADEDVTKGIGSGIKKGSIVVSDIIREFKPLITETIKDEFFGKEKTEDKKEWVMEEKATTKDIILAVILLMVCVLFVGVYTVRINNLEKQKEQLQIKYYQSQIDLKEYETAYEILEEYAGEYIDTANESNDELKNRYNSLFDKYITLLSERPQEEFDKEQFLLDIDDLMDYYINWYEFKETNPDITFENYVKIRNYELYLRINEYYDYTAF